RVREAGGAHVRWQACGALPRQRRSDPLQFPRGSHAADRARAHADGIHELRRERPSGSTSRDDDDVRRDVRCAGGVSPTRALAHRGGGARGPGEIAVPYGRDGEVRARHVLLQRRVRGALSRRGARAGAEPEGRDVRSGAGDERGGRDRGAVPCDPVGRARFHSLQLRERRHGGAHGRTSRRHQGGGDGGPVSAARARRCSARGCAPDRDRGSWQLRDDDRSGDGRAAHGPYHEPGSARARGARGPAYAARRRRIAGCWTHHSGNARRGQAHRDDRNRPQSYRSMPVRHVLGVIFVLASMGTGATRAAAQVGYPPNRSPYHDITEKQDFTVYGGYFKGNTGAAGVGPQSGALFGVRYALHIGGPAELVGRLARASSSRTVLDPNQPYATRDLGTTSQAIYLADVGITLNLTGQKSYHHFVPTAGFGLGI